MVIFLYIHNNFQYLNYEKNKKIQLKYKNTLQGGDFSGLAKFNINSEYITNIDEYYDTIYENKNLFFCTTCNETIFWIFP